MRDVPHERASVEGKRVVLAERDERDRTLDDLVHLTCRAALALRRERGEELRIALVTVGRVEERADESPRRLARAGGVELHPERREHLAGVALELGPLLLAEIAVAPELWGPDVVV